MAQLDEARTKASTITEHTADHNRLHKKANYVFDVKDYGAVGDDATDDTAAFVAAIAAAEIYEQKDNIVYVPSGIYAVSATITATFCRIWGDGPMHSIIHWKTAQTGPILHIDGVMTGGTWRREFKDFTLQGDGVAGADNKGLLLKRGAGVGGNGEANWAVKLTNIHIYGTGGTAFEAYRTYYLYVEGMTLSRPIDCDVSNVPYVKTYGCNGVFSSTYTIDRSVGAGESLSGTGAHGTAGVWRLLTDSTTASGGMTLQDCGHSGGYFPDASQIVYCEAAAGMRFFNFGYSDIGGVKAGGMTDFYYLRLVDDPPSSYGGAVWRDGLIAAATSTHNGGIYVEADSCSIVGGRGWDGTCVVLASGAKYNHVSIEGQISGTQESGTLAVIDNSGNDLNTITDFQQGLIRPGLVEIGADTLHGLQKFTNVETTAGVKAIVLPDNAKFNGQMFLIRRDGASNVTVTRAGTDTYDDAATVKTLATDGAFIWIGSVGDGEWKIIDTGGTVT